MVPIHSTAPKAHMLNAPSSSDASSQRLTARQQEILDLVQTTIARTGSDLNGLGLAGAALITVGGIILLTTRSRRHQARA